MVIETIADTATDRVLGAEPVQRAVLQAEGDHAATLAVLHQQVEREVLDEVVAVVAERLAVQRVQQRVAGPVGHAAAPMSLAALGWNTAG